MLLKASGRPFADKKWLIAFTSSSGNPGMQLQGSDWNAVSKGSQEANLPVVQGGSPELAGVAEGVWRHAADHERLAALAQLEQGLVGPHICALPAHIDGDVPHNFHALRVCICLRKEHRYQQLVGCCCAAVQGAPMSTALQLHCSSSTGLSCQRGHMGSISCALSQRASLSFMGSRACHVSIEFSKWCLP